MRSSMRLFGMISLVGLGYFLGSSPLFRTAQGQPPEVAISDDAVKKIIESHDALKKAVEQLQRDSRYMSVTKSVNPYSVLVGGIDAKEDLESGQGVDPETWAALCVATFELKKNHVKDEALADWVDTNLLGFDNDGHLTYRNKVVRIYSISRLRKLNSQRMVVLGEIKERKNSR